MTSGEHRRALRNVEEDEQARDAKREHAEPERQCRHPVKARSAAEMRAGRFDTRPPVIPT